MIDSLFSYWLLSFLVVDVDLGGFYAGLLLLITELFNVLVGPVASVLMDSFSFRKFGLHRFWTLVSVFPLAASFVCMWLVPNTSSFSSRFSYSLVIILIFNVFYGTILIAYEGMIPLLSSSVQQQTKINSVRLCVGSIGYILPLFLANVLFRFITSPYRTAIVAAIVASLILCFFLTLVFVLDESPVSSFLSRSRSTAVSMSWPAARATWPAKTRSLFSKKPFAILLVCHFLMWLTRIVSDSALPFFLSEHLRLSDSDSDLLGPITLVPAVVQTGSAAAQIFTAVSGVNMNVAAGVFLAIMLVAKLLFAVVFALPTNPNWVYLIAFVDGVGSGGVYASYEIFVPEVIYFVEVGTHRRQENIVYGWVDSVRELALALAFLGSGWILDARWEPLGSTRGESAWFLVGIVPAALSLLMIGAFAAFPRVVLSKQVAEMAGSRDLGLHDVRTPSEILLHVNCANEVGVTSPQPPPQPDDASGLDSIGRDVIVSTCCPAVVLVPDKVTSSGPLSRSSSVTCAEVQTSSAPFAGCSLSPASRSSSAGVGRSDRRSDSDSDSDRPRPAAKCSLCPSPPTGESYGSRPAPGRPNDCNGVSSPRQRLRVQDSFVFRTPTTPAALLCGSKAPSDTVVLPIFLD